MVSKNELCEIQLPKSRVFPGSVIASRETFAIVMSVRDVNIATRGHSVDTRIDEQAGHAADSRRFDAGEKESASGTTVATS